MLNNKINIAIDGHSACGKSSTARRVAEKLGYVYIDSGAMYRAITLYIVENEIDIQDQSKLQKALSSIKLEFIADKMGHRALWMNGNNVDQRIRSMEVTTRVSEISTLSSVRSFLREIQQEMGRNKGVVMDGRDIGTHIFPNAELKIFMTAELGVRAKRRYEEMVEKGMEANLEAIERNLEERDAIDSQRSLNPLRKADDAVVIDTSYITLEEQVNKIVVLAKEREN